MAGELTAAVGCLGAPLVLSPFALLLSLLISSILSINSRERELRYLFFLCWIGICWCCLLMLASLGGAIGGQPPITHPQSHQPTPTHPIQLSAALLTSLCSSYAALGQQREEWLINWIAHSQRAIQINQSLLLAGVNLYFFQLTHSQQSTIRSWRSNVYNYCYNIF